jgi:Family of unknown function (DUF5329)
MWRRLRTGLTGGMVLLVLAVLSAPAHALPEGEYLKIVALLEHVGHQTDAVFLAKEKTYTAPAAAKVLRQLWEARADAILTAEEVIADIASVSATGGCPSRIRFKNGREIAIGAYLRAALHTLEE